MSDEFITSFCEKHNIELFVEFGSRANASHSAASDLDIAMKPLSGIAPDMLTFITELERHFNTFIDLTLINANTNPLLLWEIARGRMLYQRQPGCFAELRAWAWKAYVDTAWMREKERRWLRQFARRINNVA